MMQYSPSTNGFYSPAIDYRAAPDDLVEIGDDLYVTLLAGIALGQVIVPGPSGPVLADPPAAVPGFAVARVVLPPGSAHPEHFGAAGDGVTDDTAAIQACIDSARHVQFLPRDYAVAGSLRLENGVILSGPNGTVHGHGHSYVGNGARLIFTGGGGPCIGDGSQETDLLHVAMSGLSLYATGDYTSVIGVGAVAGLAMRDMNIEATGSATAGIVAAKDATTDRSWVASLHNVRVRLPDASAGRPLDMDMSDGAILGSSFTGGAGSRLAGTGGMKVQGSRFDRSTGPALCIDVMSEARVQHVIVGNQIEECDGPGILLNGDANNARVETWVNTVIAANMFRCRASSPADIAFGNQAGPILNGGLVVGNQHSTTVPPVLISPRWKNVGVNGGQAYGRPSPTQFVAGAYRQSPLILDQGGDYVQVTGTTAEVTVKALAVPAGALRARGLLRVRAFFACKNSANPKWVRVWFGGTEFKEVNLAGCGGATVVAEIYNLTETSQRGTVRDRVDGEPSPSSPAFTAGVVNTTIAQPLAITVQLASAADYVNLTAYQIEITPFE